MSVGCACPGESERAAKGKERAGILLEAGARGGGGGEFLPAPDWAPLQLETAKRKNSPTAARPPPETRAKGSRGGACRSGCGGIWRAGGIGLFAWARVVVCVWRVFSRVLITGIRGQKGCQSEVAEVLSAGVHLCWSNSLLEAGLEHWLWGTRDRGMLGILRARLGELRNQQNRKKNSCEGDLAYVAVAVLVLFTSYESGGGGGFALWGLHSSQRCRHLKGYYRFSA